jgi:hypothetical protein
MVCKTNKYHLGVFTIHINNVNQITANAVNKESDKILLANTLEIGLRNNNKNNIHFEVLVKLKWCKTVKNKQICAI